MSGGEGRALAPPVPRAPCPLTCPNVERMGQHCPFWGETQALPPSRCFQSRLEAPWVARRWEQLWHPPRLRCLSPAARPSSSPCAVPMRRVSRQGAGAARALQLVMLLLRRRERRGGEQNRLGPSYSSKVLVPGISSSGGADSALAFTGSSLPPARTRPAAGSPAPGTPAGTGSALLPVASPSPRRNSRIRAEKQRQIKGKAV